MMATMRHWLIALGLTACGPIAYVNQVTRAADSKVEAARQANADKLSPYWWTRATQYLRMAREVAAHADFQGANHFGRLAAEAADQAVVEAEANKNNPTKTIAPAKDDAVAPAKE